MVSAPRGRDNHGDRISTAKELVRGIVQATLELACLRNNLCFEDSPPMVIEEVTSIVQDTFDALYGIGTCSEEPCAEVLRITAALNADHALAEGQKSSTLCQNTPEGKEQE